MDEMSAIARAVLYEGYVLWPYRRSAIKNQQRWTFGGVYPPSFAAESSGVDRAAVSVQCLVEVDADARLEVAVRFLHLVRRQLLAPAGDGWEPVDMLHLAGERLLSWDEAAERELILSLSIGDAPATAEAPIDVAAGSAREVKYDAGGTVVGAIERRWESLAGRVEIGVERLDHTTRRVTVRITNTAQGHLVSRDAALARTLLSAHAALRAEGGRFVSLLDPPPRHARAAAECRGVGLWPVLVGEPGSHDAMLASPIILYDYPAVAPESPGDLFDGGEIDQLLILNILTLSDEEKQEMRATDPRAREILDRCAGLSPDELRSLHGAIRSLRPVGGAEPWT